jgi:transcription-repair coupling factor (superfamily II helicase)
VAKTLTEKLGVLAPLPETLAPATGPSRAAAEAEAAGDDTLPSLELPDDRRVLGVAAVAGLAAAPGHPHVHVVGVVGAATALVAARIQEKAQRPVLCVTRDSETAAQLALDLGALVGAGPNAAAGDDSGDSPVVLYPAYEASPYADVNPDRRLAMSRLAALHRLATDASTELRFVVVPAQAFARKVVAREALLAASSVVAVETEIDRDAVARGLADAGYLRVPVVEDPGTFAVRGALLDVWPATAKSPVRIELYGDLVVSLKTFDPEGQRTLHERTKITLPPAREAILTEESVQRARETLREICDHLELPSAKARALIEDVATGRAFFGSEGFLPAYGPLASLWAYLPSDAVCVVEDPASLTSGLRDELGRANASLAEKRHDAHAPCFPLEALFTTEEALVAALTEKSLVLLHRSAIGGVEGTGLERFENAPENCPTLDARGHEDLERAVAKARNQKGKAATLGPLVRRLEAWKDAGLRVVLSARTETQAERLVTLTRHAGAAIRKAKEGATLAALVDPTSTLDPSTAWVLTSPLARGAVLPGEGLVLVTEEEVFGQRAQRKAQRERKVKAGKPFLEDLRALSVGDFVVHVEHGVGRYLGLVHRTVGAHTVDLLAVEYAGGDKLYLPVYRLNQIQKLSGADATPKMDRLGGSTFTKTKQKVEKHVRQMADELLRLYAERQAMTGEALPPRDDEYGAFEATFPFEETADQSKAIDDVLNDLESSKPMDRLVCGDVGFGKTEVAIRAAFRAAMSGRQVAVLCPTTVLAQQHASSFEARFRGYPIAVGALSRFQTKGEQDQVLKRAKEGTIDVVVGTHRLLSKDLHFKRLGLLVVDEEQRFGVTHKERIKQMRKSVDVLTLSATPIPRTLQMAVSGLRDMSLITTPPTDRRAIRTIVTRPDDAMIKEAISRELSRSGQVFYVYNRVEGLYERAAKVQSLLPSARIVVAHGQMSEAALEKAMIDFVEGRFDVLFATAIIESGLDIPRANTIVIDRADMFGLAQLYQLRGRVGRSKERAYCYLLVPPASAMTDDARARIEAMERHTELGAGFQIASLDLELRGAGDLLGAEQSGAVATVGFELFCQMLEDAVRELRGDVVVHEVEPDLSFDIEALLPETYIDEIGVRLSLYKRLASATDEAEVTELSTEMEDRFGPPPPEAMNLVQLMRIKAELRGLRVLGCEATTKVVTLHLREDTPLDPVKILALVQKKGSPYKLTPDMRLTRRFGEGEGGTALGNADTLLAELANARK